MKHTNNAISTYYGFIFLADKTIINYIDSRNLSKANEKASVTNLRQRHSITPKINRMVRFYWSCLLVN